MKKRTQFVTLALLTTLLPSFVLCGGFQLNEHGAKAMAQGGAFVARADDPSAIYFNPAGIAFVNGIQVYAGVTFIVPKVSFFGPLQLNSNNESDMVSQTFTPINVYGTYQADSRLTFGLGVNNPYGLGTQWNSDWVGKYLSTKVTLNTFFISPTVGYKVTDDFALGVGLNYVTGSVNLQRDVQIPFAAPPPVVTLDMSAHAIGFSVGALYKLSPTLSVGASYRSQVKLDASGTASFSPNYSQLSLPNGPVSSSLTLPPTAFVGIAYKAVDNLELEADYQYVGWSTYKELDIIFQGGNTSNNVYSPKDYQNTYILRVGGQYAVGDIQLRAGYLYDHSPVQTQYVDPLLPDANRNGINLGVGYKISSNLRADVSYMFLKFDQRKADNTVVNFDGTYNSSANLIGIDFGYTF